MRSADEGTSGPQEPRSTLGPFRLISLIGRGGMGVIWRAEDTRLGRSVALKLLPSELAGDSPAQARFLQEARTASAIEHPNVCSIYEVGETEDHQLYLAMPFYDGETLDRRIDRGPLLVPEVVDVAAQIARGLAQAHGRGIVHRDIKPSNVMLTRDGLVKILDFGIAQLGADSSTSLQGVAVGTPAYMAPEQLTGRPVDHRADLWALGVVMYEALTGLQPFSGESPAALRAAILEKEPEPLKRRRTDVSPRLDQLVTSLLRKDPAARPASAQSVEEALRQRPKLFTGRRLAAALALLALIGLGTLTLPGLVRRPPTGAAAPANGSAPDRRRSVAVLGFRNLSGEPAQRWLGPALAEMLTAELAAGARLRVVSNERTARAQSSLDLDLTTAPDRAELERLHGLVGSDFVVQGAYLVLEGGDRRVRLDIRILAMPGGEMVASVVEVGREGQLFDLVSRAGSRLRSALGFSLPTLAERLQARGMLPTGAEAIRLYVEALARLRSFDPMGARNLLERADALEPGSVAIQSAFAETWMMMGQDTRAREAALQAFKARQPLPQEAQLAIEARYHETGREWDRAAETYRTLQTLFPDELDYGLKLAETLSMAGRGHEALAVIDGLRRRPAPEKLDSRIDTTELAVAWRMFDLPRVRRAAEATVRKGRELGAWLLEARGLIYQSNLAAATGRTREALGFLGQAEEMALRAGDPWMSGRVDANLGVLMQQLGDLDRAEQVHRRALATARQLDSGLAIPVQLFYLGQIQRERGNLEEARALLEDSLDRFRRFDYHLWEGQAQTELAAIHLLQGDTEGARGRLSDALAASRLVHRRDNEAQALSGLAELEALTGRQDRARVLQDEALRAVLAARNPRVAAEVLATSAEILAPSDLDLARRRLLQAEKAGRRAADRLLSARLLGARARVALEAKDFATARAAANQYLQAARQSGARLLEADALGHLAQAVLEAGDIRPARELLEEALRLSRDCGDRLTEAHVEAMLARIDRAASPVRAAM